MEIGNLFLNGVLILGGSASMFFSGTGLVLRKDPKKIAFFAILAICLFVLGNKLAFEQGKEEGMRYSLAFGK